MPKPPKYSLAQWPAADRAAWEADTSTDGGFFKRGLLARCARETTRQAFYAYSRWLEFLNGAHPDALVLAPHDRLTSGWLEGFVAKLAQGTKGRPVVPQTMASTINHFCNAIRAIASDHDFALLHHLQKRFRKQVKPRNKRDCMQEPRALYELGLKLMNQAATIADPRAAAWTFRDGLLIAVATASGLRRKNLTSLAVGTNLHRVGDHYQIVIEAQDMKTRRRVDQPLPTALTPYIEDYRQTYRPRFPGANRYAELWLSPKGGVLCKEAVGDAVRRHTLKAFGRPINIHLVRHAIATSAPDLGSPLLDHTKSTLTDQFYRHGDSIAASRKLARIIADLRAAVPSAAIGSVKTSSMIRLAPIDSLAIHQGGAP